MSKITMTNLGIERLEKLIAHFEDGRPGGHEKFFFGEWHKGLGARKGFCGTLGCAAGECLVVFPEDFALSPWGSLEINGDDVGDALNIFFECSEEEKRHLFIPSSPLVNEVNQDPKTYGGIVLTEKCRASSWVKNAKEFVRRAKEQSR